MNTTEKLRKIFDIKSGLKAALEEIGQSPGKRFAEWPGLVKATGSGDGESMFKPYFEETETVLTDRDPYEMWKAEKCIYDKFNEHLILVGKLRDISADDIVLWFSPSCTIQWRKVKDYPITENSLWDNPGYDVMTDYVTNNVLTDIDYSRFDSGMKNLAPVSEDADEILYMDYFRLTAQNTRYFTFKYLPNVRKVSGFRTGRSAKLAYAFSYFAGESLSNLDIDCTGVTDLSAMFTGCANLKELPALNNTGSVNNVMRLFYNCSGLQSIDLTLLSGMTKLTSLEGLFENCSSLQSVDLAPLSRITGLTNITRLFYGCSSLQTIDLNPLSELTGVTNIANLFFGCSRLQSIDLTPLSGMTKVTSVYGLCYLCSELQSIDLTPLSALTKLTRISSVFSGCFKLQSVHLGGLSIDAVPPSNSSFDGIGDMFNSCGSLTTVTGSFTGTIKQDGFNLSASPLTAESCMVFFDALDPNYEYTIKISQTTFDSLSEEQLAVATSKGWTVSVS